MWKFQSFWNLVPGDRKKIQAGIIILINTVIKYPPDTILSVISRHVFLLHYEYIERTEYFKRDLPNEWEDRAVHFCSELGCALSACLCLSLALYSDLLATLSQCKIVRNYSSKWKNFGQEILIFQFRFCSNEIIRWKIGPSQLPAI